MSKSKSSLSKIVLILAAIISLVVLVLGYGSHSSYVDFGFRIANLVLVITILWHLVGAKIGSFFSGRTQGIASELSDLEKAKEQAAAKLREIEALVLSLDKERASILAEYKLQGEAMKTAIIAKAEKSAKQIVEQSKLAAKGETDRVVRELRTTLSEEIIAATEKLLQERLTAEEHEKLIQKNLAKVVLN